MPVACASNLGSDCKLTVQEAEEILKKLAGRDVKVTSIEMSQVKGVLEVVVDVNGQPSIAYVDCSKKYLVQGAIIDINAKSNVTASRIQEIRDKKRVDLTKIPLDKALVMGDKNAAKRAVVFTDPDCPYCSKLHDELKKTLEKRKDISFFIKLFPLMTIHKDAYWKSKTIVCKNSIQILEDNFAKKPIQKFECDTKEIDDTIKLAESLGINGTPTIVLPDGRIRSGAFTAEQIINLIDGGN
jgi:thiol:disulfide interchange protein DsbC